jgi:hypothetical protein
MEETRNDQQGEIMDPIPVPVPDQNLTDAGDATAKRDEPDTAPAKRDDDSTAN